MLHITSICNAGVYLETAHSGLLLDGISTDSALYTGTSKPLFDEMLRRSGMFSRLQGCIFSHQHWDHFDADRVSQLAAVQPGLKFFVQDDKKFPDGIIQIGTFSVYYSGVPHIPLSEATSLPAHCVFLIRAAGKIVYAAADSSPEPAMHQRVLGSTVPDIFLLAMPHLANAPFCAWLCALKPKHIIVNHIPKNQKDACLRKIQRVCARCGNKLPPVSVVTSYPQRLE